MLLDIALKLFKDWFDAINFVDEVCIFLIIYKKAFKKKYRSFNLENNECLFMG